MRILGFARLPDRALTVVADVVDNDAAFRGCVAEAADATEEVIGRAGVLFLTRPEGWQSELDALASMEAAAAQAVESTRADRDSARRVEQLQSTVARLTAELETLRSQAGDLTDELQRERDARRAADDARAGLEDRVRRLERERDAAHRRVAAADAEAASLGDQLATLRATVARGEEQREREHRRALLPELTSAVDEIARANADAAAAIDRVRGVLGGLEDRDPSSPSTSASRAASRTPPARRVPTALPPGLFADSAEAAEHLVRVPRALLVVDGYNASLHAWPNTGLADQRRRLVDAAAELAARTGTEAVVVFDGADAVATQSTTPRRGVTVRFTDADVEADETIIDIAQNADVGRPVLVATDDRRVRAAVEAAGANVLTRAQLFAVLRRDLSP